MSLLEQQKLSEFLHDNPDCAHLILSRAKAKVKAESGKGLVCPCCLRFIKTYQRPINSRQAVAMINLYKHTAPGEFAHLTKFGDPSNEISKLRYWALVEEQVHLLTKPSGKRHSGCWRLTPLGRQFVEHKTLIPKYAVVHLGVLLWLLEKPMTSIHTVLGDAFNYKKLMQPITKG